MRKRAKNPFWGGRDDLQRQAFHNHKAYKKVCHSKVLTKIAIFNILFLFQSQIRYPTLQIQAQRLAFSPICFYCYHDY